MKEKKLFSSIEGIDSKFVNEALETMNKNVDVETAEIFEPAVEGEYVEVKKSYKPLLFRGISLAAGMCAVLAAVFALNNFGRRAEIIPALTGGEDNTAVSDGEIVSDSEDVSYSEYVSGSGFTDTAVSEETTAELKEIIIDTPVSGLPEVTSPVYAAAEEYIKSKKTNIPESCLDVWNGYLLTDDKIYVGEKAVTGKEITLTCFDIETGDSEILLKETSEEILYGLEYFPICEYNGYLYLQRSTVNDRRLYSILRINLSDKTVETVFEGIYYDDFPNTLNLGNMLYIERKSEDLESTFYYINAYNMDTGEVTAFKDQASHPQAYKDSIVYLTNGALYMCDAVTGENDKKICDTTYGTDKWYYCEDTFYSDGETLFHFEFKKSQDDDPVFLGNHYFIFEVFDGEEFKPTAIFVGTGYFYDVQSANGLIAFEVFLADPHRPVGIIYDKNSGEFIRLDKEDKAIDFYSSDNRLFYSERRYEVETNIIYSSGEQYFEVIRK